jgi:hypothetical protein
MNAILKLVALLLSTLQAFRAEVTALKTENDMLRAANATDEAQLATVTAAAADKQAQLDALHAQADDAAAQLQAALDAAPAEDKPIPDANQTTLPLDTPPVDLQQVASASTDAPPAETASADPAPETVEADPAPDTTTPSI